MLLLLAFTVVHLYHTKMREIAKAICRERIDKYCGILPILYLSSTKVMLCNDDRKLTS